MVIRLVDDRNQVYVHWDTSLVHRDKDIHDQGTADKNIEMFWNYFELI